MESREVVTEEEEDPLEDLVAQERDLAAEVEVDVVVVVELEAMEAVEAVGDAEEVEVMVEEVEEEVDGLMMRFLLDGMVIFLVKHVKGNAISIFFPKFYSNVYLTAPNR